MYWLLHKKKETLLSAAVLDAFGVPDFDTLAEHYVQGNITEAQIKNLAPLVFETSEMGDSVARKLIVDLGVEL